jgi:hypothetical protein
MPSAPPFPGPGRVAVMRASGRLYRKAPLTDSRGKVLTLASPFGDCVVFAPIAEGTSGCPDGGAVRAAALALLQDSGSAFELTPRDAVVPLALVTRVVPAASHEALASPEAQAAVEKEWNSNIVGRRAWAHDAPLEYQEAKRQHPEAVFLRAHLILGIKHAEKSPEEQAWKARVVVNGGDARDAFGQLADVGEIYTVPASLASIRTASAIALLNPDSDTYSFDISAAYLQGKRQGVKTFVRPPKQWRPSGFSDPVCEMLTPLYGEKNAGAWWAETLRKTLEGLGWGLIDSLSGESAFFKEGVVLCLYVDDGAMSGPQDKVLRFAEELRGVFDFATPIPMTEMLGMCLLRAQCEHHRYFVWHQRQYATSVLNAYLSAIGGEVLRPHKVPTIEPRELEQRADITQPGGMAASCRTFVGSLMWLVRCTRPDLAYAVNCLSRKVDKWDQGDDVALGRIFGYLADTLNLGLVYRAAKEVEYSMSSADIYVRACSDADLAGCLDTARSTSGWLVFVDAPGGGGTSSLVDWSSRRQTAVAKSTAEAEIIAINDCVTKGSLPTLGFVEVLLQRIVRLLQETDSEAARHAVVNGASSALRYIRRHQRISLAMMRDVFMEETVRDSRELARKDTKAMEADLLTKHLSADCFARHRGAFGMWPIEDYAGYELPAEEGFVTGNKPVPAGKWSGAASAAQRALIYLVESKTAKRLVWRVAARAIERVTGVTVTAQEVAL